MQGIFTFQSRYKHWDKLTEMAEQMAEQILTIQDAAEENDRDSDSESVSSRPSARQTSEATCLTIANDVQHYSVMSCRKACQNYISSFVLGPAILTEHFLSEYEHNRAS